MLLEGRDAEVVAEPGAGKTLGYLLPGAELLVRGGAGATTQPEAPLMLVVLPTRCAALCCAASRCALCCGDMPRWVCLHCSLPALWGVCTGVYLQRWWVDLCREEVGAGMHPWCATWV